MNYTSQELMLLIKNKYKSHKGSFDPTVVLEEVPNGTGGHQSRWIDAAVFEMWPSKGLSRSAFEIKVSRQDFLHELQQPEKHLWCQECFHYFWFVAPKDVVKSIDELPPGAGWMYPSGTKLCIEKHATRNDSPRLDDKLLAAFMRAAGKRIDTIGEAAKRELNHNNPELQKAKEYEKAVVKFLTDNNRSIYTPWPKDAEGILKELCEAKLDRRLKDDIEHLQTISRRFQGSIIDLMNLFLVVANKGLMARNELGQRIVTAYGSPMDESVSLLKEHLKDNAGEINDLILKLLEGKEPKP